MQKLLRFVRMPQHERQLLLQALGALAALKVLAWVLPQRRLQALTGRRPSASGAPRGGPAGHAPRDVGVAVERAALLVPGAGCLPQALATQWLLHRRGDAAVLRVGVARDGDALLAHAWVECGGEVVVGGAQAAAYQVLARPGRVKGAGG